MTASASVVEVREDYLRENLETVLRAVLDMARVGIEVAKAGKNYHTEDRDRARIDFVREVCERWSATPQPAEQDAREAVAWSRCDSAGKVMLYTLRQDGWRKGQPVMVNDVMVTVQKTNASETDIAPVVSTILSALTQAAPDGWRPIETVPKDGTVIHVYAPGFDWPEAVLWEVYDPASAEEAGEDGYWTYAESLLADCTDSCEPEYWTHWRPLPTPPAQGAGG